MNSNSSTTKNRLAFVTSTLLLGVTLAFGQAPQNPVGGAATVPAVPAAPAAGGGAAAAGGGGRGGGGRGGGAVTTTAGLNDPDFNLWVPAGAGLPTTDLERTALTKLDEYVEKPAAAQAAAYNALVESTFSYPIDQARIQAALKSLASAELALGLAEATGIETIVRSQLKTNTPERFQTVMAARNTRGGGGRGGGGGGARGGAAAGGAATTAPNPAGAAAPTPAAQTGAGRGN